MFYNILLVFGGVFHIINGFTHFLYPRMYKWNEKLETLSEEDKRIIIQNFKLTNYTILLFWVFTGIIPIIFYNTILKTDIGIAFIISINIFWTIRIVIIQTFIVGFQKISSIVRTSYFVLCFLLFLIPLVHTLS